MQNHISQIDLTPIKEYYSSSSLNRNPWFKSRRFIIFIIILFLSATLALSYVYSRPEIYQSTATLLTVAKTSVDQQSREADIQHVAIQKQILMGSALLAEISKRLRLNAALEEDVDLTVADIRQMLNVQPVMDTNLVELMATGSDPAILPVLINTWIEVYLAARAAEVSQSTGETTRIIQGELTNLKDEISSKRTELNHFRQNNEIISTGREENEALARLKGLHESLNQANEEAVKAKAKLDAIHKAIGRGQTVIPQDEGRTLSILEKRAQELREELEELDGRYTREYMALSPTLKVIPEKLAALTEEIKYLRQNGQGIVVSEAQQEYDAATQTIKAIRRQLDDHKRKAAEFTARFAEHEALKTDLEGLELLFRETQARLIQIESRYTEKYPQVEVIDRAYRPYNAIGPDYQRDALLAVIGSVLLSLLCIWIIEFLTRKVQPELTMNRSDIHLHHGNTTREVLNNPQQQQTALTQQQNAALQNPLARELSLQEVAVLLRVAREKEKLLITLLLSGMTLDEISALSAEQIDFEQEKLTIAGVSPRVIPLNHVLKLLLSMPACRLIGPSDQPLSYDDLAALLSCVVADAGLSAPEEIKAAAFRHTYIIYLVRQGVRLSDLASVIGYITPIELAGYRIYSPAGPRRTLKEIDLLYPGLADIDWTSS
ncbi:Uncharacterized protein involved in exopolysaccharide biosynthesis [Nitrosomonas cryotolerans]|uniref:Uncharacterized protein involved in exopolysaccharide biosynthesis n=1 Tax=Nitrosomonas cryotolerans ATCC 49181 TaxID=1131553 RepID=A0A1N6I3D3_9PROT|nr:hypothetical protein [Nitrosomonas cryotolerans]SFP59328.1 Uncharacterized protein involved in exopolysaccharide biosynthesis [Nitrosomonas cryotolerans]SIO26547.1 Uncharacterized protein involved in exopolysaccharide biosynthesis [Nitrosomonas cryotolerans ATCC 49181]